MVVITVLSVFTLVTIETVSAELIHEGMRFASEDAIGVLYYANVWDIRDQPEVRAIYEQNLINSSDMNANIIDMFGALWAANTSLSRGLVSNITSNIFGNRTAGSMFGNYDWQIRIDGDPVFGTEPHGSSFMTVVSRRQVSGYSKGQPHVGYIAKAYLSNIFGKQDSKYVFFGGFVGQGNITVYLRGVPDDAEVKKIYFEANLGANVSLFVNGTFCGEFNATNERFRADAWSIAGDSAQGAACIGNVSRGNVTRIDLRFNDTNISGNFIGGGYLRADYVTDTVEYGDMGHIRY
ncbi:MAG: hypothetical protein NT157_03505, partial [Candidatus Micrarchaeota archaeon]|nr:hypothetical protein [Candidatus Micrarchaeota archaeon]